jgi:isopentenyl-diphosphate delta-isomerase
MIEGREEVILVDREDRQIGRADKLPAHQFGYLHRAISVCVVDERGRMLLQKRAAGKYHSAGLWTNACCTHPRPGERAQVAAERRLMEELGVSCPLQWALRTHYQAKVAPGLVENEVVHLFVAAYSGGVSPNPDEVEDYSWRPADSLVDDVESEPDSYTYWFRLYVRCFPKQIFRGRSIVATASGAVRAVGH